MAAAVMPRYHTAMSTEVPDGGPSPVMLAGSSSPAVTLSALLFSVVDSIAAPRPRAARYTAATAFGRLVTAASTTPPVMICGTPKWLPSAVAARSMATLASTTTTRAATASSTSTRRPCGGWMISSSSCSSSEMATASHDCQRRAIGRRPSRSRPTPRMIRYGSNTRSTAARPAAGGMAPVVVIRQTAATQSPTTPPSRTTLRCRAMLPATRAPRPSNAARLNTFEPMMTPAPTFCWCWDRAATAEVISGASAARAASTPSSASDRPSRSPIRSSLVTSR